MKKTLYNLFAGCILSAAITASAEAQTINTFCGGTSGFSGDGGHASAARLNLPGAIRHDQAGNIYVMDVINARMRKISGSTYTINTIAGTGTAGFTGDGGAATSAQINQGTATGADIAIDLSNNIYFCDNSNHCIRKINTSGVISTIAGTGGTSGYSGDGSAATSARFFDPLGLAIDVSGNLYVADHNNSRIRKINSSTGIISTIAGNGTPASSGDGAAATAAEIEYPTGVVVDAAGNVYFSEYLTGKVRKIDAISGNISTFATGMFHPAYMEFDQVENLFVGSNETLVYRISTSGVVDTVAGNGISSATPTGDGGSALAASIRRPCGVSITPTGNLLISTNLHDRIRIVTANTATITGTPTTCVSGTTTFTASIPDAAWISGNTAVATVSATGVVTGVSAGTATITYVAGLVFGTRVVTVNAPTAPTISASGATLSVPGTFATYQWTLGGSPIAGATNNTHTATTSGTYAVDVTDAGGCSATSADFTFTTSVGDLNKTSGLLLFPNPATNGHFTINIPGNINETATITITNAVGEKVYETTANTNEMVQLQLPVPAGLYVVHATTATQQYNTKVMVK